MRQFGNFLLLAVLFYILMQFIYKLTNKQGYIEIKHTLRRISRQNLVKAECITLNVSSFESKFENFLLLLLFFLGTWFLCSSNFLDSAYAQNLMADTLFHPYIMNFYKICELKLLTNSWNI